MNQQGAVGYISMNLAAPPFDDIYVRRAMNFAIDKAGLRQLAGGEINGEIAGHVFPDALAGGLLKDYDPYATPGSAGDLATAKEEMARSKYDTNRDGVCDAPACKDVFALASSTDPSPQQAALIQSNLQPLGITLDVKQLQTTSMYAKCNDLAARVPMCLSVGWLQDYSDAYTVGPPCSARRVSIPAVATTRPSAPPPPSLLGGATPSRPCPTWTRG